MLEKGANVDAKDLSWRMALQWAARDGHEDITEEKERVLEI